VTDISPLRELKHLCTLRMVGNYSTAISDLTPLQGLPLSDLHIYNSPQVTDLSPLKGMALQELRVDGCPIADFGPLAGMPMNILMAWSWTGSDLSPLRGMPLTQLNIGGNGKPTDLTPLAGAPLEFLCCNSSGVSDLTPLKGMPLKTLMCESTSVSDLSPLRNSPLQEFIAGHCPISDFSVLRELPLTWANFDVVPERDLEILRAIRTLGKINDQRASDFLREWSVERSSRPVSPAFTNSLGMEFVQIPKGKAWLARKVGEEETSAGHETVIDEDFFLSMYEVTQEEWVKVMGSNPSWFTRNADGAEAVTMLPDDVLKRLPVERVSWTDCQLFLTKLNELEARPGWVYRLPTEAEWQYACRGGPMTDQAQAEFEFCTTTRAHELTPDDANIQHELCWNRPCRVGLFPPNPLGLYDMHGNVWEWCDDGPPWRDHPSRFIHGGGWNDGTFKCRVSAILQPTEPWTYYDLGLRVARVPVKQ
jgi:formylglycine-generating enzyme required for sulfatase activity